METNVQLPRNWCIMCEPEWFDGDTCINPSWVRCYEEMNFRCIFGDPVGKSLRGIYYHVDDTGLYVQDWVDDEYEVITLSRWIAAADSQDTSNAEREVRKVINNHLLETLSTNGPLTPIETKPSTDSEPGFIKYNIPHSPPFPDETMVIEIPIDTSGRPVVDRNGVPFNLKEWDIVIHQDKKTNTMTKYEITEVTVHTLVIRNLDIANSRIERVFKPMFRDSVIEYLTNSKKNKNI